MTEHVNITLAFAGVGVANGRMDVNDVVNVLSGFAGAYSRIARSVYPTLEHRLTLTAIERGSIQFLLEAIAENPESVAAALEVARSNAPLATIRSTFDLIKLYLHLRGGKPEVRAVENHIEVTNSDGATIQVSQVVNNFYNSGAADVHLDRLTLPLEKDGIDVAEFRATANDGETLSQRVDAEDRVFLENSTETFTERMERELLVRFTSLNKETNKGRLKLADGKKGAPYEYVGDDPSRLHTVFGTYYGMIKAECKLKERSDSSIAHVTIYDFQPTQQPLLGDGDTT